METGAMMSFLKYGLETTAIAGSILAVVGGAKTYSASSPAAPVALAMAVPQEPDDAPPPVVVPQPAPGQSNGQLVGLLTAATGLSTGIGAVAVSLYKIHRDAEREKLKARADALELIADDNRKRLSRLPCEGCPTPGFETPLIETKPAEAARPD